MPEYIQIEHTESFRSNASARRLVTPTICVSSGLQESLEQGGESLQVDDDRLLGGVGVLGMKRPVEIRLAAISDADKGDGPLLAISWADYGHPTLAEIEINPGRLRATRRERRRDALELNTAFWLGATVCNALANGQNGALKQELANRQNKSIFSLIDLLGGIIVGNAARAATNNALLGSAVGASVFAAELIKGVAKRQRLAGISVGDFAIIKYQNLANVLAEDYPAIHQGAAA